MKKIILLTLSLMCHSAFASKSIENVEYYKMGNFVAKEACVTNHFQHVAVLVDLKTAKQTKDVEIEKALSSKFNLIRYENDTKFIRHSMEFKNHYLVENKKNGTKSLYLVNEPALQPIKNCIVLMDEVKPENSVTFAPKE